MELRACLAQERDAGGELKHRERWQRLKIAGSQGQDWHTSEINFIFLADGRAFLRLGKVKRCFSRKRVILDFPEPLAKGWRWPGKIWFFSREGEPFEETYLLIEGAGKSSF